MTDHEHTFCPHCKPCRLAPRMVEAEDALRSLAAYLGNGGYNDPRTGSDFDVKLFEMKIRDGIDAAMRLPKPVDGARVVEYPRNEGKASGWTIDPNFLDAIYGEIRHEAFAPSLEGIELVLLALERQRAVGESNERSPDDDRDAARYRWVRDAIDDITGDEAGIQGVAYSFQVPLAMIEKATAAELLDAVADAAIVMDDQEPMRGRDAP